MKQLNGFSRVFVIGLVCSVVIGCDRGPDRRQIVERMKTETAKVLKTDASRIDVNKPLLSMGANELDVAVIMLTAEEEYHVQIMDEELAGTARGTAKTLTVNKLASMISARMRSRS